MTEHNLSRCLYINHKFEHYNVPVRVQSTKALTFIYLYVKNLIEELFFIIFRRTFCGFGFDFNKLRIGGFGSETARISGSSSPPFTHPLLKGQKVDMYSQGRSILY